MGAGSGATDKFTGSQEQGSIVSASSGGVSNGRSLSFVPGSVQGLPCLPNRRKGPGPLTAKKTATPWLGLSPTPNPDTASMATFLCQDPELLPKDGPMAVVLSYYRYVAALAAVASMPPASRHPMSLVKTVISFKKRPAKPALAPAAPSAPPRKSRLASVVSHSSGGDPARSVAVRFASPQPERGRALARVAANQQSRLARSAPARAPKQVAAAPQVGFNLYVN